MKKKRKVGVDKSLRETQQSVDKETEQDRKILLPSLRITHLIFLRRFRVLGIYSGFIGVTIIFQTYPHIGMGV